MCVGTIVSIPVEHGFLLFLGGIELVLFALWLLAKAMQSASASRELHRLRALQEQQEQELAVVEARLAGHMSTLWRSLLLIAIAGPGLVQAQAYKCNVNGKVVFQQHACEGGTKLNVPKPPDPQSRDARVAVAIAKRQVIIGMTEEEVVRSWGKPDKINRSITARNVNEQWIYEREHVSRSQYLYLENGVLRSVQSPE